MTTVYLVDDQPQRAECGWQLFEEALMALFKEVPPSKPFKGFRLSCLILELLEGFRSKNVPKMSLLVPNQPPRAVLDDFLWPIGKAFKILRFLKVFGMLATLEKPMDLQ